MLLSDVYWLSESCFSFFFKEANLFSKSAEIMVGSPMKVFSLFKLLSRAWHSLQRGMYISSPPISCFESLLAVLNVKLALSLQSLQMADNFLIFSHFGRRAKMLGKVPGLTS